jgi:hypothetical protein
MSAIDPKALIRFGEKSPRCSLGRDERRSGAPMIPCLLPDTPLMRCDARRC